MAYAEILMRVRTESFVALQWPGRAFSPVPPEMIPVDDAKLSDTYWVTFDDSIEPRTVGLLLSDITDPDAVFVVVMLSSDGTARRSLWRYQPGSGWRRLGGDGTPNS
jgi:hypothetical protein